VIKIAYAHNIIFIVMCE